MLAEPPDPDQLFTSSTVISTLVDNDKPSRRSCSQICLLLIQRRQVAQFMVRLQSVIGSGSPLVMIKCQRAAQSTVCLSITINLADSHARRPASS